MLCSQMSAGLPALGPINCSNPQHAMMLGMMSPCCFGPAKCQQQIPTPCANDTDYNPNSEITLDNTMLCSQMSAGLLALGPINCSNLGHAIGLVMMSPCCGSGPIKCHQQIPTPCVNDIDYNPNFEITMDNNTMLCSQMSAGLLTLGPIDCSNLVHAMSLGMMSPCCGSGPAKCHQQIPTPCVNDIDYNPNSEITMDNNTMLC